MKFPHPILRAQPSWSRSMTPLPNWRNWISGVPG
jgi:hypothetical protein